MHISIYSCTYIHICTINQIEKIEINYIYIDRNKLKTKKTQNANEEKFSKSNHHGNHNLYPPRYYHCERQEW